MSPSEDQDTQSKIGVCAFWESQGLRRARFSTELLMVRMIVLPDTFQAVVLLRLVEVLKLRTQGQVGMTHKYTMQVRSKEYVVLGPLRTCDRLAGRAYRKSK